MRDIKEMRRCVSRYVQETLFKGEELPPTSSRRFFPLPRDVRNHMYNAEQKLKFSKIDQENLLTLIGKWRAKLPKDKFFFRGYSQPTEADHDQRNEKLWFNEDGTRILVRLLLSQSDKTFQ